MTTPAKSCFRVANDPATKTAGDQKVTGKFVTTDELFFIKRIFLGDCNSLRGTSLPATDIEYTIDKASLLAYDRQRFGWTYGVMITPSKYYPAQQHIGASATIGGYAGYRILDRQGISDTLALSVGTTSAAVTDAAGVSTNQSGTTLAIVFFSEIKNKFVVGVVVGQDSFSATSNYLYNGKTWIGINFGLKAD